MKKNQTAVRRERKVSASRLRRFIAQAAEDITEGISTVNIALRGNTFEINLEGATINITINEHEEGGRS